MCPEPIHKLKSESRRSGARRVVVSTKQRLRQRFLPSAPSCGQIFCRTPLRQICRRQQWRRASRKQPVSSTGGKQTYSLHCEAILISTLPFRSFRRTLDSFCQFAFNFETSR